MDSSAIKVGDASLEHSPERVVIFIHGYTGGTADFGELPALLRSTFGANIIFPLLPGHGTKIENLIGLTEYELFAGVEREVKEAVQNGKEVILIGLSMGAQAALYLASKYPVEGVVAIAITHQFRFPLNLPIVRPIVVLKTKWQKRFTLVERNFRLADTDTCYEEMPSDGWFISQKLRSVVNARAKYITQPVLFIHSENERLASPNGVAELTRKISGPVTTRLLKNGSHNMFYSNVNSLATAEVLAFVRNKKIFQKQNKNVVYGERATAVIPAYNEASRIEAILKVLSHTTVIDEIIVIDDGSNDDTAERVSTFPNVLLLRNVQNIGKGASMERGVRHAKNDIIFFCDADLNGFTVEHAEAIIQPVREGSYVMFIGVRGNFMQRAIKMWALNSGERALRKTTWNTLPSYYKYRYRIEVGLNRHVSACAHKSIGWKMFDYTQPLKESKYGFLRGTLLRWWMNFDVFCAYIIYPLIKNISQHTGHQRKVGPAF